MERYTLWLSLTAVIIPCTSGELCVDINVKLVPQCNDKRVTDLDTALWTTSLSLTACLEKCYQDSLCLSVNVAPDTDACIGFKQKFEGRTFGTEAFLGYRVYETVKTLSTDCSTVDHCSTNFGPAHCQENVCRCDIGYSLDGSHCRDLTECTSFANTTSEYPGYVKWSNDFHSLTGETVSSCRTQCVDHVVCQTADFQISTGECWLDNNNWYGVDEASRGSDSGFIYIQRECNW